MPACGLAGTHFIQDRTGARSAGEMETPRDLWLSWTYRGTRAVGRSTDSAFRGNGRIALVAVLPQRTAEVAWPQSPAWDYRWWISADLLQFYCAPAPKFFDYSDKYPSWRSPG